jgi:hypothetical protein
VCANQHSVNKSTNRRLTAQELFHDPPKVHIVLGDQGSRDFWQRFREQMSTLNVTFDVILDDGDCGQCQTRRVGWLVMCTVRRACTACMVVPYRSTNGAVAGLTICSLAAGGHVMQQQVMTDVTHDMTNVPKCSNSASPLPLQQQAGNRTAMLRSAFLSSSAVHCQCWTSIRASMEPAWGACKRVQITTFENAWPLLADGGVYICEDTSTSMVRARVTKRRVWTSWVLALVDPHHPDAADAAPLSKWRNAGKQATHCAAQHFSAPYRRAASDALQLVSEPDIFAVLCRTR